MGTRLTSAAGRALAALVLLTLSTVAILAQPATAERAQRGPLIVNFSGSVSPLRLPRHVPAPVALTIESRFHTDDDSPLPRLTRLGLVIAGRGVLTTRGLPLCPRRRLRNARSEEALRRCRGALVGRGQLETEVFVPHQEPFSVQSRLLAFNGRTRAGRPAVWVHAYSLNPPLAIVMPFVIDRHGRRLGASLEAVVPRRLGSLPHLIGFKLTLFRRFWSEGVSQSYLRASCPAPPIFSAGFTYSRAKFDFEGSRDITVEAVRSCRAL